MQFKAILAAAALATSVSASRVCGTADPTPEQVAESQKMLEAERFNRISGKINGSRAFAVQTYVHVVALDNTVAGGYLTVSFLLFRNLPSSR